MKSTLKPYLSALLEKGLREDKRKPIEYRSIKVEANPLPKSNGSARVFIGKTEVLVGVKLDVGTPFPDSPEEGTLMVNTELSPLASPNFESGPPRAPAIELARVVDRGIRESHSIDMRKLCITPKEKVWMVIIDIYPLNDDGNLFDASALGAITALKNARFPKYDEKEGRVLHKELTKEKLPIKDTPVICTFGKINDSLFLDPSSREEQTFDARLSIATVEDGNACAMQKGGIGTLTASEIDEMVGIAIQKGKELRKLVK